METIVELVTENCAAVESRAFINISQRIFNTCASRIAMQFRDKDNRKILLFGVAEGEIELFELLTHPELLTAIKIGGDMYYLQWYTKYQSKRVEDGLMVDILFPLCKKV